MVIYVDLVYREDGVEQVGVVVVCHRVDINLIDFNRADFIIELFNLLYLHTSDLYLI